MKKLIFINVLLMMLLGACTQDVIVSEEYDNEKSNCESVITNNHRISLDKAASIADAYSGKTRNDFKYEISYVMSEGNTRTESDTLAYIFNYNENNGFVMVSSDDRVFPILAYSDKGNLTYEKSADDIVYANFIRRIEPLIESVQNSDESIEFDANDLASCVSISPMAATTWSQGSPYNKYVIQEHPGCPVGCVAVAAGQLMVNCWNFYELEYHDMVLDTRDVRDAFKRLSRGETQNPNYPFSQAYDDAAKLLYYIGKDINMTYTPGSSSASASAPLSLLKSLDFPVNETTLMSYNESTVARLIYEKNMVYMVGWDNRGEESVGHAWIADGTKFCWSDQFPTPFSKMRDIFIYCNWGWGGSRDGYFNGSVFSVGNYEFGSIKYFSVENQSLTIDY